MKNSERFIGVSQSAEDYWRFVSFADFCPVLPLVLLSIHFFLSSETSTVIGPTLSGFFFRSSAVIGPKRRVLDAVTVVVCFSCGRLMRPFVPLMSKLKSKPSPPPPFSYYFVSYFIKSNPNQVGNLWLALASTGAKCRFHFPFRVSIGSEFSIANNGPKLEFVMIPDFDFTRWITNRRCQRCHFRISISQQL